MSEEKWFVITWIDGGNEARSHACPTKAAALSLARDRKRQHADVVRIEGPNDVVIRRAEIEQWIKDHPE